MHDPLVVAFTIVRPWPSRSKHHDAKPGGPRWAMRHNHKCGSYCSDTCRGPGHAMFPWWKASSYSRFWVIAGRGFYWPAAITIWHREPDGHDSGTVCKHQRRWQDADGKWHSKHLNGWRWHLHHWRIQVAPLQELRRWALTRCEWCGGRSKRRDYVNVSHSWDRAKQPWWRGERGLFHHDCSTVQSAHGTCTCPDPLLSQSNYGQCAFCGRSRGYGAKPEWLDRAERIREALPPHTRDAAAVKAICR